MTQTTIQTGAFVFLVFYPRKCFSILVTGSRNRNLFEITVAATNFIFFKQQGANYMYLFQDMMLLEAIGSQPYYSSYTKQVRSAVEQFNASLGKPYLEWPTNFQGAATDFERVICLIKVLVENNPPGKLFCIFS